MSYNMGRVVIVEDRLLRRSPAIYVSGSAVGLKCKTEIFYSTSQYYANVFRLTLHKFYSGVSTIICILNLCHTALQLMTVNSRDSLSICMRWDGRRNSGIDSDQLRMLMRHFKRHPTGTRTSLYFWHV